MSKHAMDGALLDQLVMLSIPLCQKAQSLCPRPEDPDAKPVIPDWVLGVMIMVAIMLKKKTKSAQYVWWREHCGPNSPSWLPGQAFPARSTFFDRYRRVHDLYQQAIALQGQEAVKQGWADARCVAGDKSLIAGRGPRWNVKDRDARAAFLSGVGDRYTTWGYCQHDGWVQGYAFEVVVTAPKKGVVWPLLASADTASRSEQKTIHDKIPQLPLQTMYVLVPLRATTVMRMGEAVEWERMTVAPGDACCTPENPRPNTNRPCKPSNRETLAQQQHHRQTARRAEGILSVAARPSVVRTAQNQRRTVSFPTQTFVRTGRPGLASGLGQ